MQQRSKGQCEIREPHKTHQYKRLATQSHCRCITASISPHKPRKVMRCGYDMPQSGSKTAIIDSSPPKRWVRTCVNSDTHLVGNQSGMIHLSCAHLQAGRQARMQAGWDGVPK